jgi:hypothetical protein
MRVSRRGESLGGHAAISAAGLMFLALWCLSVGTAAAVPLIDYTNPALINELGGKESHEYPWGSGGRSSRSALASIEFIGNGQRLNSVSAVFGFADQYWGTPNVGGPASFTWHLRCEPIAAGEAGTFRVDSFWNTSNGNPIPPTHSPYVDLTFATVSSYQPNVATFMGVNLGKVTLDASGQNYVLQNGQRYRCAILPESVTLTSLPSVSFSQAGPQAVGSMWSYYHTLFETPLYGANPAANSAIGLEGAYWAYAVDVPCTDSDGGNNAALAGVVRAAQGNFADYCVMRFNLIEQFCNPDGTRAQQRITCPNGCLAGRCQ